jgi:hypothetical protein
MGKLAVLLLALSTLAECLPGLFELAGKSNNNNITFLQLDLGTTINGYHLTLYGMTLIPNIPPKYQLKDFSHYPSSLITSFMHSTDQNAVELLLGFVNHLTQKASQKDLHLEFVLKNGVIWFLPYISIDAYELAVKRVEGEAAP